MRTVYPWTSADWKQYLFETFRAHRADPCWEKLKDCHDLDDWKYFEMLEELYANGKITLATSV